MVSATPHIVNGAMPPLTRQQRRLLEIFAWYLRSLPPWEENKSWASYEYDLVNRLLYRFFQGKNPAWSRRPGESKHWVEDLPEKDCAEYRDLMLHSGPQDDPRLERRRRVLGLAHSKQRALRCIEWYEEERAALGLEPDFSLPRKPATPIEQATEATWGNSNEPHSSRA